MNMRRRKRTEDSIFWPRKDVRIWRRFQFKVSKFLKWSYEKGMILVIVGVLMLGSYVGWSLGKYQTTKTAEEKQNLLQAKYEKSEEKAAKLEKELRQIQIKEPKMRPWYLTLVNDAHPMPEKYVPELAKLDKENSVDKRILKPLKKMLKDAEKAGVSLYVCSSYRSVERQQELYDVYMKKYVAAGKSQWEALKETREGTAYPGRSEHGIGLAVDIISNNYTKLDKKQQETKEAKWLAENCYKYGFILRYPVDKTDITGVIYEPWHYRYVGVEDATEIMKRGITLEEYLGEVH